VGRAPALLGLSLFALLVVYYETSTSLWNWGLWGDVAWIACVLIPAVFALALLALPLARSQLLALFLVSVAFVVLAVVFAIADLEVWANFSRFAAEVLFGWWFLQFFESLSWVLIVAAIIPFVDSFSVWRGPTKTITTEHPQVFDAVSFAFPVPGEHSAAELGPPDVLFFALFLAAAARFDLRVVWTFVGMVVGLGLTIAATTEFAALGLPALPGIALGFLVPNADLIYRHLRTKPASETEPVSHTG
jgi:hypothetical protein